MGGTSFEDKLVAAQRLRELGITRPILVDDLEGTVHRAYGLMPNMSWVLSRGGTIHYKGQRAISEFARAEQIWAERARAARGR